MCVPSVMLVMLLNRTIGSHLTVNTKFFGRSLSTSGVSETGVTIASIVSATSAVVVLTLYLNLSLLARNFWIGLVA